MWRRAIKVGGARVDRAAKEANAGARALPIIRVLDMSSTRAQRRSRTTDDRIASAPSNRALAAGIVSTRAIKMIAVFCLTALGAPVAPRTGAAGIQGVQRHSRRNALGLFAAAAASTAAPQAAFADPSVKVYFGAGCFWHVQHEFVGEEIAYGRGPNSITAVSGYAGGQRLGPNGRVCYHNMQQFADYGSLGHAEAVQLEIPQSAFPRFAKKYFSLFGERGMRHDPQDRGGEYRSVLGLPGGESSPLFDIVKQAALESPGGMKLYSGRGDDPECVLSPHYACFPLRAAL